MNILLLEDDVALNKAITKVLQLDKHQVDSFTDGQDIIHHLDDNYDLYILDINVPHITGLELLKIIMKHDSRSKVIMISSNTDIQSLQSAYDAGCVDYLKKPFYTEELRVKVNRLDIPQRHLPGNIDLKEGYDSLSKKERDLLLLLLENQEYIVSYEMIDNVVYENQTMTPDAIRALIRRLRAKLPNNMVIRNIVDEGYTLSVKKKNTSTQAVDITALQKLLEENALLKQEKEFLLKRSITDPLTGLYNRLRIRELFLNEKQRFIDDKTPLSLIMLDLDDFKKINDKHGHNTGDKYLKTLALMLKDSLRSSDVIGRWGGEEFIILLRHTSLEQAEKITEKLKTKITKINCPLIGPRTASMGISQIREDDTLEDLIQRADEALLRAKILGKNRIVIYRD